MINTLLIGLGALFGSFLMTYLLWVLYLAVMSLKRAKEAGALSPLAKALGIPVLFVAYLIDSFVNIFVFSIILLEHPKELTVTSRLKRHYKLKGTWGYKVALWSLPLLEPYDPGHITNV